jgi:ribosomal protein L25 (general stress protein Ctc)
MSAHSRNKGSGYELEIARTLFDLTGITFKRDLEQVRAGEHGDLVASDPAWPFVIECKRRATGTGCQVGWKVQAATAAVAQGKLPAVIYRFDRQSTRVAVPFSAIARAFGGEVVSDEWAEITVDGLVFLAREMMAAMAEVDA